MWMRSLQKVCRDSLKKKKEEHVMNVSTVKQHGLLCWRGWRPQQVSGPYQRWDLSKCGAGRLVEIIVAF